MHVNADENQKAAHGLQGLQRALYITAVLFQSHEGFEDGLPWMHGPIKLVVHAPPEPVKHGLK